MKKTLIAAALALSSLTASASEWTKVAGNVDVEYSMKNDSVEMAENNRGDVIVVGLGKIDRLNVPSIVAYWYVTMTTCSDKYGMIIVTNLDGKMTEEVPFALSQKTMASSIGNVLCSVAELFNKNKSDVNPTKNI